LTPMRSDTSVFRFKSRPARLLLLEIIYFCWANRINGFLSVRREFPPERRPIHPPFPRPPAITAATGLQTPWKFAAVRPGRKREEPSNRGDKRDVVHVQKEARKFAITSLRSAFRVQPAVFRRALLPLSALPLRPPSLLPLRWLRMMCGRLSGETAGRRIGRRRARCRSQNASVLKFSRPVRRPRRGPPGGRRPSRSRREFRSVLIALVQGSPVVNRKTSTPRTAEC
jgi:hypothetical protein